MSSFFENILNAEDASPDLAGIIKSGIKERAVKKGEILLNKGGQSDKFFFVKTGCLRSYFVDKKGKEHIFMFAPEGWLASDISSVLSQDKSQFFIDATEDSLIEQFDYVLLEKVQSMLPDLAFTSRDKFLKRIAVLQKRILLLMSADATERYLDFIETYPNIIQRVPQKMVASYLGITPEALSLVRAKLNKK